MHNTPFPRIRSLTLGNLIPHPLVFYEQSGFARLISSLEHLHLSTHGTSSLTEGLWEEMWQETIPIRFLMPPQRQLTSLVLVSDQPVGLMPHVELAALFYPALRHLTLGGVMFTPARRAEDFVARHRRTLASLVLDSCPMHIDNGAAPERTWGAVCERFHDELEALVDLHISLRTQWGLDQMHRAEGMRLTYERSLTGFGYPRGESCALYEAADRPALDKLVAVVRARKERLGGNARSPPPPPLAAPVQEDESRSFVVPVL